MSMLSFIKEVEDLMNNAPDGNREQNEVDIAETKIESDFLVPYGTWYDTVVGPLINDE